MQLTRTLAAFLVAASASAAAAHADVVTATPTEIHLEKRLKEKIINKDFKKLQDLKAGSSSTSPTQRAWIRTIYSTQVEIVTPTVIAGVTFSAKPPATTNGLEPWVSLDKDGAPKTIQPKHKGGKIDKASPDYSTYFQTATTIIYSKEELKAHNMKDDTFEHVEYIPEDLTYQQLNPIIRCTPDRYRNRGHGKDHSLEPFCTPEDNRRLYMDRTYFVTWYTRFFSEDVKSVRLHLSYIKESLRQKGTKRNLVPGASKRSVVFEGGGKIDQRSFFVSDPIDRDTGMFALTVLPEWFSEKDYYHKVLISLQPDNVADEDFDYMKNYLVIEIAKKANVAKGHQEDIKKLEEKLMMKAAGNYDDDYDVIEGPDYEKYFIIMSIPMCVILATFGMWLFVLINKRNTDISFLRKVKFNKRKNKSKYSTDLPRWDGRPDLPLSKRD